MIIGGEFYYDDRWVVDTPTVDTAQLHFLNGGKACLIVICEYLLSRGFQQILLPAYLCPTILSTIRTTGMGVDFYTILPDLSIDLNDLARKAPFHRAVYFINYFGFNQPSKSQELLRELQRGGILLIEDNAHAGFWQQSLGDFTFNSMRKLCPYDGGYFGTALDISQFIQKDQPLVNRHLQVMRQYRRGLGEYLVFGLGSLETLQALYQLGEETYDSEAVITGDDQEKQAIEHLDWQAIKARRRQNYRYLLEMISSVPRVTPIFPQLTPEVQPMGFPVYIQDGLRDRLFDDLGNEGIGLTIHWDALLRNPLTANLPGVAEIASQILTLPIDQRVNQKQLDRLVLTMAELIRGYTS